MIAAAAAAPDFFVHIMCAPQQKFTDPNPHPHCLSSLSPPHMTGEAPLRRIQG
eukprot:CAMPEP_0184446910 /NCGR_PEP_ID=MMETSP0740-20130409/3311_1 /TAXON_ID=385413 /ORGANISM="Thalassiosira miniscula, Strain CCMP1093" /LENGTH=52 /DNA_ID=CAMNT_0026816405 /DNA_START=118 /DNA_END=273 /DNA_ORIENTATION=+